MNWDSAWLTTKATVFVVAGLVLYLTTVIASVGLGTLMLLVTSSLEMGVFSSIIAVATTATVWMAGIAGRRYLLERSSGLVFSKIDVKTMGDEIKRNQR